MNEKTLERKAFILNVLYFALAAAILYFCVKYALGWVLPFLIAFLVSMLLRPVIRFLAKNLRCRRNCRRSFLCCCFTRLSAFCCF